MLSNVLTLSWQSTKKSLSCTSKFTAARANATEDLASAILISPEIPGERLGANRDFALRGEITSPLGPNWLRASTHSSTIGVFSSDSYERDWIPKPNSSYHGLTHATRKHGYMVAKNSGALINHTSSFFISGDEGKISIVHSWI